MRAGFAVAVFLAAGAAPFASAQPIFHVPADGSLTAAIAAVPNGGVIEISAGTYVPPAANGFQIVNQNKSFTIRGVGGVVLSGNGTFRVLQLTNGQPVIFENLTFANGLSTTVPNAGGVTLLGGKATFVDCTFTGNNNASIYGGGGTLLEAGSTAIFLRSSWTNNRATNFAAGLNVSNGSSAFVHDSEFVGNRTNFPGHATNAAGGALYVVDSTVRVTNTRFLNNEAGYVGGAIYEYGSWAGAPTIPHALVTVANCYFEGNKAKRDPGQTSGVPTEAGAIHVENQGTLRIYNSRFLSNLADVGGALSTYRGEIEVYSSTFRGNTHPGTPGTPKYAGTVNGGSNDTTADGTNNRRNAKIVIQDSLLQGRVSGQTAFPDAGGCIYASGDQVRLFGLFGVPQMGGPPENRATLDIQRSVLFDCDVVGNGIGGGISTILTALTLGDSIVMRSGGVFGGGLAALIQSFVTVTNSTFSDNTASFGGAILAQGSTVNVSGSRLVHNNASTAGSAIRSEPDSSNNLPVGGLVSGNTIAENTGTYVLSEGDANSPTRYNAVQYNSNAIHVPSGNAYQNDLVGNRTVAGLNTLTITRTGGPTTDKSPNSDNTAPPSGPVVGQIVAVPPAILNRGAHNETGPFPSNVGYAWGGAGTATVNGVSRSGSGVDSASSAGQQTLQVSATTFTDNLASAVMPSLGFFANPPVVPPGNSSTLSWSAVAGTFFEIGLDHNLGVSPAPSGSVGVTPPQTTTYRAVAVAAEGGADGEVPVVVGIPPLVVSPSQIPGGVVGTSYSVTFTQTGGTPPITWSVTGGLPTGLNLNPSTGQLSGTPSQSGSFWITVRATDNLATQGSVTGALSISKAAPFVPAALVVDAGGNSVFEAGETVTVAPSWQNATGGSLSVSGAASGFTGPGDPNPAYTINDGAAGYGTVADGATSSCTSTGNCFQVTLQAPIARPTPHWDARVLETLSSGDQKHWLLHVGESFGDVPRTNPFYRFVETLLHDGITGGCSATSYCPNSSTTRAAMAVFALVAKEGAGYLPPACGVPVFADVQASSPFCRWIEELYHRGIASGCGGGNYCPNLAVTRDQMAIFMLRTLDPALTPPACGSPLFGDVPASSPYCRWIEELARRGVVSGCGGGNYCPTSAVTRGQMGVFLTVTFGLTLYGP